MEDNKLLCRQCRNIFKIPVQPGPALEPDMHCPKCGSRDVVEAPVWAPLGSGSNIFDSSEWEYECQLCRDKFKMPIPKSPSEEKGRSCPSCGSRHLHLLTDIGAQPLYCG
jgi:rRNA maturation endonuclease Nob1